jgi:hypothetical protein
MTVNSQAFTLELYGKWRYYNLRLAIKVLPMRLKELALIRQKDKQSSTKHYTEAKRLSNTNLTKTWSELWKG